MRVAIIGSGPAGLFCADRLAGACDVTIFEAGLPIEERMCPETGCISCEICHILEGEGGAGGLSDGKNTYSIRRGTQMESVFQMEDSKWMVYIDRQIVKYAGRGVWISPLLSCPQEFKGTPFMFDSYPLRHVGSDGIQKFVRGFSDSIQRRGVKLEMSRATPLLSDYKEEVLGVEVDSGSTFREFDIVVLAVGLQGIPWMERFMSAAGSEMSEGPAGFGIRLEADADILAPLHDKFYDYKIVYDHPGSGLMLRSFCCNQRGFVINEHHNTLGVINVNGHSFLNFRTRSSNAAIIAKMPVGLTHPSPQHFVRSLAREINSRCGGSAYQPLLEFMTGSPMIDFDASFITNRQSTRSNIAGALSLYGLLEAFRAFITELNKIVPIISVSSVVYAPEIKYYGRRVGVTREWKSKDIERLYVIGSGSGHMDSFVAAALSGIVAAENIKEEGRE